MTYTPTTDTRIDHYRKEAIAHLEAGELYYAKTALEMATSIYEDALRKDNITEWTKPGVGVSEKIEMIQTGTTHIKHRDAAGVEHIGLIDSFEYGDEEWVFVKDITPPQSGRHATEDMWDIVTNPIEILEAEQSA